MGAVSRDQESYQPRNLIVPLAVMAVLWAVSAVMWMRDGDPLTVFVLAWAGLISGAGVGVFLALPQRKRPLGRRLLFLLVGTLLLVLALVTDHGNMQIEGLFFALVSVTAPYIIFHYLLAKIIGPLLFGRIWCGWACWFGMVFDLLPYPYSRYRIPGRWGWIRYIHFAASLVLVVALVLVFGYRDGAVGQSGLEWFIAGLAIYYALGVMLALILKDNRAFCKYVCPISVPLKAVSRFSTLKVTGTTAHCGECIACVEMCPMNIRVRDYLENGERVLSTECTLCLTCINVCPHDSLKLSFSFDRGGKEYIDYVPPKRRPG